MAKNKSRYYALMEIVGGPSPIMPMQPIPEGRYSNEKLLRMLANGVIASIDAPPKPIPVLSGKEIIVPREGVEKAAFEYLPAHKAISPALIEGLGLDEMNEQAVAAGWQGAAFTDTVAAAAYLSKNWRPADGQ